ncbi:two-component system response regulator [Sulfitobacter alexandrii]|uniref:Two-component system response regulator n=1 Tax=Sulfitobacter alexandrii TaxID=1917485 RepID=A0A1J0WIW8_9RHOB|nr:response regulator [Sulfitobacter alexandrii]APE44245.1 two-component system response regulator [Sulfitobacter alexandrii]
MKILAVDDDPIIMELLTQFIEAVGGHELTTAESGAEALDLLRTEATGTFDCFMLDIQMPSMDGIELTRRIRMMARYADTPILMLTAMADKRYIDGAFAAGATDYVTKPFEVAELKARLGLVAGMIEGRRARTRKIFAATAVGARAGSDAVELHEPISIHDVDNVIEYVAMENYVQQLTRSSLFGSSTFAFTVREIEQYHATMTPFEFYSLVSDVAEVISDTLHGHQFLMSYAGSGTFVCITESGWRPDMGQLVDAVNLSLARTELYNNAGERLHPRVSGGDVVRLIWKSGAAVMDALATAHATAEAASAQHGKSQTDYWNMGQIA